MHISVNSLRLMITMFEMYKQILSNFALFPLIISLCIVVGNVQVNAFWMEFEMGRVDNANGSLIKTDLRSTRFNKKTFTISGTIEIVSDITSAWQFEGPLFYSSKGNNQFTKSALGIHKTDLCNIIDGAFKFGGGQQLAEKSDLPEPKEGESLCAAYKKGKYTLRDFLFNKKSMPIFLHPGYYKAQFIFSNKASGEINIFAIYFKLY